jgi:hypothetical protein
LRDTAALGVQLVERLETLGYSVTSVMAGAAFARLSDTTYVLRPTEPDDYRALLTDLISQHKVPQRIAHLWLADADEPTTLSMEGIRTRQSLGFASLLLLMQAIGAEELPHPLHLDVVTSGLEQVGQEPVLFPEKATVLPGSCYLDAARYQRENTGTNGSAHTGERIRPVVCCTRYKSLRQWEHRSCCCLPM